MYVYHGMSHEAYIRLLNNNFEHIRRNWRCSDPNHMYFWKTMPDDDAIRYALESGAVGAALSHSKSESLHVLCLDIPDEEINDFPDFSAPNMDDAIAIPKSMLEQYDAKIITYEHVYTPSLGLLYLAGCSPEYLDTSSLTELEQNMLQHIRNNGVYLEELFENYYNIHECYNNILRIPKNTW